MDFVRIHLASWPSSVRSRWLAVALWRAFPAFLPPSWKIWRLLSKTPATVDGNHTAKMDGKAVTRQKVAILIAGTVARFHLNTSAEHLVAPLVQSGWEVDYFSSLFLGQPAPWKAKAEVKELEADWEFQQANETHIKNIISQKLSSSGARVIFNHVFSEQDVDLAEKNFIDTDMAFWPRPERRGKTARNNFILMWFAILWQKAKKYENMHGTYSYVIMLRDDAYWFRDFNLTQILELRGIERLPGRPGEGQLYSVLCDETHISTGDLDGLIDYFFLVDPVAADIVCTTYERIIQPPRFGDGWASFRKKTHFHNSDLVRWKCHMCFALTSFFGKNILENTFSRRQLPPGFSHWGSLWTFMFHHCRLVVHPTPSFFFDCCTEQL